MAWKHADFTLVYIRDIISTISTEVTFYPWRMIPGKYATVLLDHAVSLYHFATRKLINSLHLHNVIFISQHISREKVAQPRCVLYTFEGDVHTYQFDSWHRNTYDWTLSWYEEAPVLFQYNISLHYFTTPAVMCLLVKWADTAFLALHCSIQYRYWYRREKRIVVNA